MSYPPNRKPHLTTAQHYWTAHLRPGDLVIDATCGNGHDALFIAQILFPHPEARLIAIDRQPQAIQITKDFLGMEKGVDLFVMCHSDIDRLTLPRPPRLIVYNLGYLPGGDKTITTLAPTTLQNLDKATQILARDGAISITCYPGHQTGLEETAAVIGWAKKLNPQEWNVCHHQWINRSPTSPCLIWIKGQVQL